MKQEVYRNIFIQAYRSSDIGNGTSSRFHRPPHCLRGVHDSLWVPGYPWAVEVLRHHSEKAQNMAEEAWKASIKKFNNHCDYMGVPRLWEKTI